MDPFQQESHRKISEFQVVVVVVVAFLPFGPAAASGNLITETGHAYRGYFWARLCRQTRALLHSPVTLGLTAGIFFSGRGWTGNWKHRVDGSRLWNATLT